MRFPGGALFSSPKAPEPLPPIPEPTVAPVADDKARKNKRRRASSERGFLSGRLSTDNISGQRTVLG